MWGNVVLNGGSTLFPGMAARLQKQLTNLAPSSALPPTHLVVYIGLPGLMLAVSRGGGVRAGAGVRVIAPPERLYATWIGGSMLASRDDFASMTVSAAAYAEHGTALPRLPTAGQAPPYSPTPGPHTRRSQRADAHVLLASVDTTTTTTTTRYSSLSPEQSCCRCCCGLTAMRMAVVHRHRHPLIAAVPAAAGGGGGRCSSGGGGR